MEMHTNGANALSNDKVRLKDKVHLKDKSALSLIKVHS